jgi:hypothetical protein
VLPDTIDTNNLCELFTEFTETKQPSAMAKWRNHNAMLVAGVVSS